MPEDKMGTSSNTRMGPVVSELVDAQYHPCTLQFSNTEIEQQFLAETSASRVPVLLSIAGFDVFMHTFRTMSNVVLRQLTLGQAFVKLITQFGMLSIFYAIIASLHLWARQRRRERASKVSLNSNFGGNLDLTAAPDHRFYKFLILICRRKFSWHLYSLSSYQHYYHPVVVLQMTGFMAPTSLFVPRPS